MDHGQHRGNTKERTHGVADRHGNRVEVVDEEELRSQGLAIGFFDLAWKYEGKQERSCVIMYRKTTEI